MASNQTMTLRSSFLLSLVLAAFTLHCTRASEPASSWQRFRGENGAGRIENCDVPLPWQESDVAWKIALPGVGNGSPVVQDNYVFIQSANAETAERYLLALDLKSGKELWRKTVDSSPHRLHRRSSYASPTPCVSADAVYVVWGAPSSILLQAFTLEGEEIWSRDLGTFVSQHGFGASPALFGDTLILFNSQQADQVPPGRPVGASSVVALDAKTGETRWQTKLTTSRVCYGVPTQYVTRDGNEALLFSNTGDGLFALELKSGSQLWNKKVFEKRCVSSPVVASGLAIGTEGSGGGGNRLFAVDLEGEHEMAFQISRSAPYVPTPVIKDDLMFLWDDNGVVSCVQLPEGKVLWSKRTAGGSVSSSPVVAGNKLIGISEAGTLTVLAADTEFQVLGEVELGETTRATPLINSDYMLIRTDSHLICVGKP